MSTCPALALPGLFVLALAAGCAAGHPIGAAEPSSPTPGAPPEPARGETTNGGGGGGPGERSADTPRSFELALGETVEIEGGGPAITFTELLEDSRCPQGVNCVWAGRVRIGLAVTPPEGEPRRLELSTESAEAARGTAAGHAVTLESVEPYPVHGETLDPDDYRVTLAVEP